MHKLTCGTPQPLTLQKFMPSASLFFSPQLLITLHVGHSTTTPGLLAAFSGAAEGPTSARNIAVPFPRREGDEVTRVPYRKDRHSPYKKPSKLQSFPS